MFEHDYKKFPELTAKQLSDIGFTSPHQQITEDFRATVVKVNDGDTVTLATTFRDFTFPLRLLNIDSPEMNNGGIEAREWLKNLVLNQKVDILIDSKQRVGKYGRLLGVLFYNGLDVGQEEIHLGLAAKFGSKLEGEISPIDKVFSLKQWF